VFIFNILSVAHEGGITRKLAIHGVVGAVKHKHQDDDAANRDHCQHDQVGGPTEFLVQDVITSSLPIPPPLSTWQYDPHLAPLPIRR
jgi:hypothetical protein